MDQATDETGQLDITSLFTGIKKTPTHYENTPMQHTAIFHACKNDNFHLIFFDYFHIFA